MVGVTVPVKVNISGRRDRSSEGKNQWSMASMTVHVKVQINGKHDHTCENKDHGKRDRTCGGDKQRLSVVRREGEANTVICQTLSEVLWATLHILPLATDDSQNTAIKTQHREHSSQNTAVRNISQDTTVKTQH